jgi:hypothetical protein
MGGVLSSTTIEINYLADFSEDHRPRGPVLPAEPGFGALLNQVPDGNI